MGLKRVLHFLEMPKGKAKAAKKAVAQSAPIVKEITPAGSAPKSADSNPEDDLTSSTSKVAIECNAVIKLFVQGARCVEANIRQGVGFKVCRD